MDLQLEEGMLPKDAVVLADNFWENILASIVLCSGCKGCGNKDATSGFSLQAMGKMQPPKGV